MTDQSDIPPQEVDKEFSDSIINAKKSLYENIVNNRKLDDKNAQSLKLLVVYLKSLQKLYTISIQYSQNTEDVIHSRNVDVFPEESREAIKLALECIFKSFKNTYNDTSKYEKYIQYHLKENQFLLQDFHE
jgi:uncharacterized protein YsxB (DUF464 family)